MKSAGPTEPTLWRRVAAFLRKVDDAFPLITPFAIRRNGRAYTLFLNGKTILIERPSRSTGKSQAR